jgi:signal transduction histidine kinase
MPGVLAAARRPVARAAWDDARFLIVSFVMGVVGFVTIVTAVSTASGLAVVFIGVPLAAAVAHYDRWWCAIERGRAERVLGRPVLSRYRPPAGDGWLARRLSILKDRQTWLDAGWMLLAFPLGIVELVAAVLLWGASLGLLTAPIWLWSIPGWIHAHVLALSLLFPCLALPAAVLTAGLLRALVLGHAGIAARMLGQSRAQMLEQRVETLSQTRAGAVDAAVTELQRVERDLHDGAQARLVALAMDLGLAEQRLAQADPETAMRHVAAARGQARAAMAELRDLVRGIGPSILTDRGLDAALTALVAGREPPVSLRVDYPRTEVGAAETAAYFVVAEALTNARKHARASAVSVHVWHDAGGRLLVEVVDDGVGGADPQAGSGLAGLRKRVAALDGSLTVASPPGGPTSIRAELPCAS